MSRRRARGVDEIALDGPASKGGSRASPLVLLLALGLLVAGCGDPAGSTGGPRDDLDVDAGASFSADASVEDVDGGAAPRGVWARAYEGACPAQTMPSWTVFTWAAVTPDDARIELFARVGDTKALAEAGARVALATASYQSGNSAFVHVGERLGGDRVERWLVVEGDLYPSSSGDLPVMMTASMSLDCLPAP